MRGSAMTVEWPDGSRSRVPAGDDWLQAAQQAGITIPTGCLGGSCGACEIEVNGEVVRASLRRDPGGTVRGSLLVKGVASTGTGSVP